MSVTFIESTTLAKIDCGECGGTYAINEKYRSQRARDGGGWHCPYCQCSWGYFNNNENAQLKKAVEEKERELRIEKCRALDAIRAKEAEQVERVKAERRLKRVNRGVCPCCNRTFLNLQRHMETKHPTKKA